MLRICCCLPLAFLIVGDVRADEPVQFRTDVIAALSCAGCNSGAFHGSPQGKNGFRLSLRGFEPDVDYNILAKEQGGRCINRLVPEDSLILLKGSGRIRHQGGALIGKDHPTYKTIVRWINEGCRDSAPLTLTKLEVLPGTRQLTLAKPEQQLAVRAHFKDGSTRDVSDMAVFSSSEPNLAPVTPSGFVRFSKTGEASILARYLDQITSIRLTYVEKIHHSNLFAQRRPTSSTSTSSPSNRELQLSRRR